MARATWQARTAPAIAHAPRLQMNSSAPPNAPIMGSHLRESPAPSIAAPGPAVAPDARGPRRAAVPMPYSS
jgi:hypothetical protein